MIRIQHRIIKKGDMLFQLHANQMVKFILFKKNSNQPIVVGAYNRIGYWCSSTLIGSITCVPEYKDIVIENLDKIGTSVLTFQNVTKIGFDTAINMGFVEISRFKGGYTTGACRSTVKNTGKDDNISVMVRSKDITKASLKSSMKVLDLLINPKKKEVLSNYTCTIPSQTLTKGRIYVGLQTSGNCILVVNDRGRKTWAGQSRFKIT